MATGGMACHPARLKLMPVRLAVHRHTIWGVRPGDEAQLETRPVQVGAADSTAGVHPVDVAGVHRHPSRVDCTRDEAQVDVASVQVGAADPYVGVARPESTSPPTGSDDAPVIKFRSTSLPSRLARPILLVKRFVQ